jgi:hypothetical protein
LHYQNFVYQKKNGQKSAFYFFDNKSITKKINFYKKKLRKKFAGNKKACIFASLLKRRAQQKKGA